MYLFLAFLTRRVRFNFFFEAPKCLVFSNTSSPSSADLGGSSKYFIKTLETCIIEERTPFTILLMNIQENELDKITKETKYLYMETAQKT